MKFLVNYLGNEKVTEEISNLLSIPIIGIFIT